MAPYLSPAPPRVLAHRGLALAAIENTVPAFMAARALGVRFLETDAHVTRDGVAVLWHDPTLQRFDGSRDRIDALTWPELRERTVAGVRLSTLAEAFEHVPDAKFNIDLKAAGVVEPVIRAIGEADALERVLIASFSDQRRREAASQLPGIATSVGMSAIGAILAAQLGSRRKRAGRWVAALDGAVAVQVPRRFRGIPVLTPSFIETAHEVGVEVHVWTVNTVDEMRELRDLGVDGVVTDRADLAVNVFALSTGH